MKDLKEISKMISTAEQAFCGEPGPESGMGREYLRMAMDYLVERLANGVPRPGDPIHPVIHEARKQYHRYDACFAPVPSDIFAQAPYEAINRSYGKLELALAEA
jgi:hypothetical protein